MGSPSHASTSYFPVSVMRVALAVRTGSALSLPGNGLSVSREAGEGGVHLAEGKRPAAAEVGVVVALQVVAVARFAIEEPEEGHGNAHTCEHTLRVYVRSIDGYVRAGRENEQPTALRRRFLMIDRNALTSGAVVTRLSRNLDKWSQG